MKYIDLGLPSGTLWSEDYTYERIRIGKLLEINNQIPSKDQIYELFNLPFRIDHDTIYFKGFNNNELLFNYRSSTRTCFCLSAEKKFIIGTYRHYNKNLIFNVFDSMPHAIIRFFRTVKVSKSCINCFNNPIY